MSSLTIQDAQFIHHISELYDHTKRTPGAWGIDIDNLDQESARSIISEKKEFTYSKPIESAGKKFHNLASFPGPALLPLLNYLDTQNWIDQTRLLHPNLQSTEMKKAVEVSAKEKLSNNYRHSSLSSAKKQFLKHILSEAYFAASDKEKVRLTNLISKRRGILESTRSTCERVSFQIQNFVILIITNPFFEHIISGTITFLTSFITTQIVIHLMKATKLFAISNPVVSLALFCLSVGFGIWIAHKIAPKIDQIFLRSLSSTSFSLSSSFDRHKFRYYVQERIKVEEVWMNLLHANS